MDIELEIIVNNERILGRGIIDSEGKITFREKTNNILYSHGQKDITKIYKELNKKYDNNYKLNITIT